MEQTMYASEDPKSWNLMTRDKTPSFLAGQILADLADRDDRIVVLTADLKYSNRSSDFQARHPERFINVGIAEQTMVTVAAGMAASGKIPYAFTFASFLGLLCAEQIRTDCAFTNLPVRIMATHSGMSMGYYGTSHHALEDLGITRSIANLTVVSVADAVELASVLTASLTVDGPMYIRLGRGRDPQVFDAPRDDFQIGRALRLREGRDITLITHGSELAPTLEAARLLDQAGIAVRVVDCHTITPLDVDEVLAAATETGAIMTVEEHNVTGGIGSAVAEVLAEHGVATRFKRHGVPDEFVPIGPPLALYAHYRLDGPGIASVVKEFLGSSDRAHPGQ